jgi:hypothetical protein
MSAPANTRSCEFCGYSLRGRRCHARFCSARCRRASARGDTRITPTDCELCGVEFVPRRRRQRFCSSACRAVYWRAERERRHVREGAHERKRTFSTGDLGQALRQPPKPLNGAQTFSNNTTGRSDKARPVLANDNTPAAGRAVLDPLEGIRPWASGLGARATQEAKARAPLSRTRAPGELVRP